jgi:hypothetical protein
LSYLVAREGWDKENDWNEVLSQGEQQVLWTSCDSFQISIVTYLKLLLLIFLIINSVLQWLVFFIIVPNTLF